jgi:hypothetical protein
MSGSPTEEVAMRVKNEIKARLGTNIEVVWGWRQEGNRLYGNLYPNERTHEGTYIVRTSSASPIEFQVSVGSSNRSGWINRLHAAGFPHAEAMSEEKYPGKVKLQVNDTTALMNEVVFSFLAVPWRPRNQRAADYGRRY